VADADVLVVGAGIIGCAVARELAVRGQRVLVLDSRDVSLGATQASAGVLAPYIEAHEGGPLLDLTVRSLALYDRWVDAVRRESGLDVEYRRNGSIEVSLDHHDAERLRAIVGQFGASAHLEWLDADGVRRAEPSISPSAVGAVLAADHGFVAASALTRALARAVEIRDGVVHAAVQVTSIDPSGDGVVVTTADGDTFRASRVVVAAGSWASHLRLGSEPAAADVRPIRGQLLRVTWHGRPLERVVWGARCYLVPWADGTVLVGATMEDVGFEERNTVEGVRGLLEHAIELLPEMASATFLEARSGLRPATSDGLPIVGTSGHSDRVILATGHFRNGVMLAPLTAVLVADLIVDGKKDPVLEALAPARVRKPAAQVSRDDR
jgi:glycine oxidase ThiO